jgi:hypothetical protein
MVFARRGDGWDARSLTAADVLHMPEIEVDLPLVDIYADAEVADAPVNEDTEDR